MLGTTIRGYGHVIVVKGVNADGKLICNDPYWRPHGAGDDIYSWDDLGNCPFVVIPDRVVANTQPTQPTAPATTGKAFDSINALTGQPETITVNEPFLSYWQKNGGLPIFGLPITPEAPAAQFGLGFAGSVQYFERARFEWHDAEQAIMLGRAGAELLKARE